MPPKACLDLIFERVPISLQNFNFQIPQTRFTRQCNITAGQYPCLVKGCYTQADICNGRPDLNYFPEKHKSKYFTGSMSRTFCVPRSALCFWWIRLDWTVFKEIKIQHLSTVFYFVRKYLNYRSLGTREGA